MNAKRIALGRLLDEVTCMWLPNRQYRACSILQHDRPLTTATTLEPSKVTCPQCVVILPVLNCLDQPL